LLGKDVHRFFHCVRTQIEAHPYLWSAALAGKEALPTNSGAYLYMKEYCFGSGTAWVATPA
jgi:hypothetical protein